MHSMQANKRTFKKKKINWALQKCCALMIITGKTNYENVMFHVLGPYGLHFEIPGGWTQERKLGLKIEQAGLGQAFG